MFKIVVFKQIKAMKPRFKNTGSITHRPLFEVPLGCILEGGVPQIAAYKNIYNEIKTAFSGDEYVVEVFEVTTKSTKSNLLDDTGGWDDIR